VRLIVYVPDSEYITCGFSMDDVFPFPKSHKKDKFEPCD
jgi:hypothetical protein